MDKEFLLDYDFEKHVNSSLRAIEGIHSEKAYRILSENGKIHNSIAVISKNENLGFTCMISSNNLRGPLNANGPDSLGLLNDVLLERNDTKYLIDSKSVISFTRSLSSPILIKMKLKNFQSGLNEDYDNKLLRLIIPIEKEVSFNVFVCKGLKINDTVYGAGLVETQIADKHYHIFKYKNNDLNTNYLIIDSVEPNHFSEFKENTKAILLAFGLITGNLIQGELYFLTNNPDDLYINSYVSYYKVEDSIISNVALLDPFQFRLYLKDLGRETQIKNNSFEIETIVFANLCKTMKINSTYSRCCSLLIEGHQSKFLLLQAAIYSLALETITSIIYEENKEQINPIPDKNLAREIKNKLKECLSRYDSQLTDYGKTIINAKINDLNKPTNSKKLSMPFEMYGISLSNEDIKILNHRNKFLHGTSPFEEEELKSKEYEIQFITSKLLFLVSCLMLKCIGYTGHVIHFPSFDEMKMKQVVKDHFYKLI